MTGRHLRTEVTAGLLAWAILVAVVDMAQGRTAALVVAALPVLGVVGAVRVGAHTVAGWSALGLALVVVAGLQLVRDAKAVRPVRVEVTTEDLPAHPQARVPAARRLIGTGHRAIGGVR